MTLPFDLPILSRGFAALTPGARETGAAALAAAARGLSELVGREVTLTARAVPGRPASRSASARVTVDLPALPGSAVLDVDAALVVGLVDLMAGGTGEVEGATALTPVEATALELMVLAAVEGTASAPEVEEALAPRLVRGGTEPASGLAVEIDVAAESLRGRARLIVPHAAIRALGRDPDLEASPVRLPASLRRGAAVLDAAELEALAPGDVVVVDPPADGRDALVFPGGLRALGRIEEDAFHAEEIIMTDRHARLPVTLEVELARTDVPLAELARLEPGAVLALGLDRRGLVTLRAGERAVARGELVDVEGAVGVRILSLEVAP